VHSRLTMQPLRTIELARYSPVIDVLTAHRVLLATHLLIETASRDLAR
jgi:hypothetical protein